MNYYSQYRTCRLCPRNCGVNRFDRKGDTALGFCRETAVLRVSYVGPHFGEEPPITGTRGSGTVFFSGCSLRCSFCQNHQISQGGLGKQTTLEELLDRVERMILEDHVHNINLVTPDHFFPHVFHLVALLRRQENPLPIVFNLSGYQSRESLRMAREFADIYLPDFKYADSALSEKLSKCRNYPDVALEAISEMVKQKGFLDSLETGEKIAQKGVLVRHLILPGEVENSLKALTSLFLEFGPHLPLSLMSQYTPALPQKDKALNRGLFPEEFQSVYSHVQDLGFDRLFVQFPDTDEREHSSASPFLPDFRLSEPFSG